MRQRLVFLACGLACVLSPLVAAADPGDLLRIFRNPNPSPPTPYGLGDQFGDSMAVLGNKVLIGAPYAADENGEGHPGKAYLFDGNTGELLRTFWNPEPFSGHYSFGSSTATLGNNFLIGGPNCGVYLFDGSTGELLRSFQDPDPTPTGSDQFGWSVAALGENVLVGDPTDSPLGEIAGAVYLLDGSTGDLLRTFYSPDPTNHVRFGLSVAAVGPNVLVGTPDGDPIQDDGIAYLFDGSTGEVLLTMNDPEGDWHYPGEYFGSVVTAYGDDLLVAGHSRSEDAGVFLFDGATGDVLQRFMYPGFEESDGFGHSIAVVGNGVLVGAGGSGSGKGGYLFDRGTGDLLLTIHDPGVGTFYGTAFGAPVASFGRDILIAAQGDDSEGQDFGRVYLFQGVPEPSTLALLAIGAAALIGMRCRRRRVAGNQVRQCRVGGS